MTKLHQQFVVDKKGHKKAVILPLDDYESLIEDIHDLSIAAERKKETKISLTDFKKRLKEDGLL